MHSRLVRVLAPVLATLAVPCAHAEEESSWLDHQDATGDWRGVRHWLDDRGVHLDLDYTAEVFGAVENGTRRTRATYRGTLDLALILDTDRLALWPGGTLFTYAQHGHGRGLSGELGTLMPISNLEAPPFTQLSELWYEQSAFGELLLVRVGKQDANRDFGAPRFPGNFIHSSYGVLPTIPMPSFPAPGLGAMVSLDPKPWLGLRSGIYEVAPRVESLGLGAAFQDGTLVIASVQIHHAIGIHPQGASYGAGAWYQQQHAAGGSSSNSGGFVLADLWIPLTRDGIPGARTIQTFVRVGWSRRLPGIIDFYVGGGVTYHLPHVNDTVGIGAGHVMFSDSTAALQLPESFIEVFYKRRFAAWLTLEPDLQIVVTPGGARRTVWIGGVRLKLKL